MILTVEQVSKIICHTSHDDGCVHRDVPAFYGKCGGCRIAAEIICAAEHGLPQDPDNIELMPADILPTAT
jgi:hypothetical protein